MLGIGWQWICKVLHCPCTGRQPFHEAGIPEGLIRDSVTVQGRVITIDQPKAPGRPLNG